MLVRVYQHAMVAAKPPAELVQPLAQGRVGVPPRVARQPSVPRRRLAFAAPVAEGRRDDGASALDQRLGVARDFGPRHREAHVREEAALLPLADMALGVLVGRGRSRPDHVEPQFFP